MVARPEVAAAETTRVEIEHAERGNIVRWERVGRPGTSGIEIIEGTQGSANLQDRTRRLVHGLVTGWYPVSSSTNGS